MNELDSENTSLFFEQMQGVKPIKAKEKIELRKGSLDKATAAIRRKLAETEQEQKQDYGPSLIEIKRISPHDIVGFKRPGIQDGVYRKLRLGRYEAEARLDLHQMRVEQAEKEVERFLQDCLEHDIRTVLILPGKGERNIADPSILKSHLAHWLEQDDRVQAFHSAQPQHGGAGAFYVLLRKSERKKQLARETFRKGRVL
ncbi:MAG: DNA endonuclease SmrA [Venatoribacter sp.]